MCGVCLAVCGGCAAPAEPARGSAAVPADTTTVVDAFVTGLLHEAEDEGVRAPALSPTAAAAVARTGCFRVKDGPGVPAEPVSFFFGSDRRFHLRRLGRRPREFLTADCARVHPLAPGDTLGLGAVVHERLHGAGRLVCLERDQGAKGQWVAGIVFSTPVPSGGDGAWRGHRYFQCAPGCGVVAALDDVRIAPWPTAVLPVDGGGSPAGSPSSPKPLASPPPPFAAVRAASPAVSAPAEIDGPALVSLGGSGNAAAVSKALRRCAFAHAFVVELASGARHVFAAPTFWEMQVWVFTLAGHLLCAVPVADAAAVAAATHVYTPLARKPGGLTPPKGSPARATSLMASAAAGQSLAAFLAHRVPGTAAPPPAAHADLPWHWGSLPRADAERVLVQMATVAPASAGSSPGGAVPSDGLFLTRDAAGPDKEDGVVSVFARGTVAHVLVHDLLLFAAPAGGEIAASSAADPGSAAWPAQRMLRAIEYLRVARPEAGWKVPLTAYVDKVTRAAVAFPPAGVTPRRARRRTARKHANSAGSSGASTGSSAAAGATPTEPLVVLVTPPTPSAAAAAAVRAEPAHHFGPPSQPTLAPGPAYLSALGDDLAMSTYVATPLAYDGDGQLPVEPLPAFGPSPSPWPTEQLAPLADMLPLPPPPPAAIVAFPGETAAAPPVRLVGLATTETTEI